MVVDEDSGKEIPLQNLFEESEIEEDNEDVDEDADDSDQILNDATKVVDDLHVCQLCPEGNGNVPFSIEISQMSLMKYHFQQEHNVSSPRSNLTILIIFFCCKS